MYAYAWYELVQVKGRKLFAHQMPLALSTRPSYIWYHSDRHDQYKRVTWSFFVAGPTLGLGTSGENVPPPTAILEKINNINCFRRNEPFSLCSRFQVGTPTHACKQFRANIRRCDCPKLIIY